MLRNVETAEGLREHERFIEKRFLSQRMSRRVRLRMPPGIIVALERKGVKATPWAVTQLFRKFDYEREREIVAPAFLEGDIETVYYAACVTWHYAWSEMARDKAAGLMRGVDASRKLVAGDFVKIDAKRASDDGTVQTMSWILRVIEISPDVASVE
ncbi:hypothetical protein P7L87_26395, partial [Vibrio parahaemolyticus]|nr:hypothetical protein [Vibrio parahaemolyticus]